MIRAALLSIILTGAAAADTQAIRRGTAPDADQIGHVFVTGCAPGLPALMEKKAALFETAFGWSPVDAGTDAAFAPDGRDLIVTFDANYEGAICEMTIPRDISGDCAAVYDGLDAHLTEKFDALPAADAIDGGLKWEWDRSGTPTVTYIIEFIETNEGHTLSTQAKLF